MRPARTTASKTPAPPIETSLRMSRANTCAVCIKSARITPIVPAMNADLRDRPAMYPATPPTMLNNQIGSMKLVRGGSKSVTDEMIQIAAAVATAARTPRTRSFVVPAFASR